MRVWTHDQRSPYINLGRPTLQRRLDQKRYTLNFALQDRRTGKLYVSEMKCELEYDNYRYMILQTPEDLKHHKGQAFTFFLDSIDHPEAYTVQISGKTHPIDGAILVWGHCSEEGRIRTQQQYGFHAIVSLQDIIQDLHAWNNAEYNQLIRTYHQWSNELFRGLQSNSH